jgi:hypothetical protein
MIKIHDTRTAHARTGALSAKGFHGEQLISKITVIRVSRSEGSHVPPLAVRFIVTNRERSVKFLRSGPFEEDGDVFVS